MLDSASPTSVGYTVAPGRCVTSDDGRDRGPGEIVELAAADAERLLALGYILRPDGSRVIDLGGPAVGFENGEPVYPAAG